MLTINFISKIQSKPQSIFFSVQLLKGNLYTNGINLRHLSTFKNLSIIRSNYNYLKFMNIQIRNCTNETTSKSHETSLLINNEKFINLEKYANLNRADASIQANYLRVI